MKSRSHRQPISEPRNDDWVDGSWTVDCICGVNFDDGEEMVDCDECGVWVHTRCVRFVKGEKSFSCDKCKNRNSGIGNDSEETEVAEFLVELPTKTLRMDNPSVSRDCRLWTKIPMEERVHMHGVPGGEPGLFSGSKMSSVFGPVLWRCSGYVPKKFSSKYNEFPWCGNGEIEENGVGHSSKRSGEENADHRDDGAGVLLSLSKEEKKDVRVSLDENSDVAKSPLEDVVLVSPKKKLKDKKVDSGGIGDHVKESSSVKSTMLSSSKRKEELGISKVHTEKKKAMVAEKECDDKRPAGPSNTVLASTFSSDAKQLEFSQARGPTTVNDDVYCSDVLGECATNLALRDRAPEASAAKDISNDDKSNMSSNVDQALVGSECFTKTNDDAASLPELTASKSKPVKDEDIGGRAGNVGTVSCEKEPAAIDSKEMTNGQYLNVGEADSGPNKKLKEYINDDRHKKSLPVNNVKVDCQKSQCPESPGNLSSEDRKTMETSVVSPEASQPKMPEGSKNPSVGSSNCHRSDRPPVEAHLPKQTNGSESNMGARKKSSGLKNGSDLSDGIPKSNSKISSHSTTACQSKGIVSVGRNASASSGNASKFHNNHAVTAPAVQNPSSDDKQELSKISAGITRENLSTNTFKDDEKYERRRKLVKESSRLNPVSKTSSTKSHMSDTTTRVSPELKGSTNSASKVPSGANSSATPGLDERATPIHIEDVQNKAAAGSALSGPAASNPLSKGNVATMIAAATSNVPAHLSDEELAFLLHQELNSSPRVPRVPRMRHAGSLPQITSPTATSMLMKRTSSGGSKDISMTSRRRSKDLTREGSRGPQEADNEAKKIDKKHSSPENRRREAGYSVDPLSKRDADGGGSSRSIHYKKTNVTSPLSSSGDANGHSLSSRPSSRNKFDYDPRTVGRHRTLPGLIAEIMSEGKRMTYEELCNAVLPHWPHLRKHNGERYAYSSHSQAVLDCLRNRSEWARLVDRGPKTSASRKRRKNDTDSVSNDSEDNEHHNRAKKSKGSFDSHQEDFPKGKRKARKGRRMNLQGRGMVRRRRRAEVVSDDESESYSDSSEQSMSSEEEIQGGGGGGTSTAGDEASASSDEVQ